MRPVIDVDKYIDEIKRERARKGGGSGPDGGQQTNEQSPQPKPLPAGLAPVASFSLEFLPDQLAPWVGDISNRLQCPPDYAAVAATVALGALIGRRVAIKPQQKTDWTEIANIWGGFIGRPGMLKSPAMGAAPHESWCAIYLASVVCASLLGRALDEIEDLPEELRAAIEEALRS